MGRIDELRYVIGAQKFKVWMDRFDDVVIYSTRVLITKLQYIHYNPVEKGLVRFPEDYIHSSAGFYLKGRKSLIPILDYSELL